MSTSTINFKIDNELKEQFQELAKDLGATTTTLLTMFVKRAVDDRALPFEVRAKLQPNEVYRQLLTEEQAKQDGVIPDDATIITEHEKEAHQAPYR